MLRPRVTTVVAVGSVYRGFDLFIQVFKLDSLRIRPGPVVLVYTYSSEDFSGIRDLLLIGFRRAVLVSALMTSYTALMKSCIQSSSATLVSVGSGSLSRNDDCCRSMSS